MKKTALLLATLALYSGSASAVIHWSEGYPEPNEIPLAPWNMGQSAPVHTNWHDLMPSVPGLEAMKRQRRSTVIVGANQTYSHSFGIYNSNTGALLREMPVMSYTALATDEILWSEGFFTIGTGLAAKTYSVQSMYAMDLATGAPRALNVRVIQHPATGPLVVKYTKVFPVTNVDGNITHDEFTVKDINGDGIEELVAKYGKVVLANRIHTYLIYNVETGAFIRKLTLTTPK